MIQNTELFECPVCRKGIVNNSRSLVCEAGHTFDVSSSGYVNLNTKACTSGDSKTMAQARSRFLDCGYYKRFSDAVTSCVKQWRHENILDAGCGEGYYSVNIAKELENTTVLGFDLSKPSVEKAAKRAKAQNVNAGFFVGGIFDLPIKNESIDVIINLFAPCADEEFYRILKTHGKLIMGVAGENHLLGLKNALYNSIYLNHPEKVIAPNGFIESERRKVTYETEILGTQSILDLFTMTPYYWKTSQNDAEKLKKLETLKTALDFEIITFEKTEKR